MFLSSSHKKTIKLGLEGVCEIPPTQKFYSFTGIFLLPKYKVNSPQEGPLYSYWRAEAYFFEQSDILTMSGLHPKVCT